MRSARRRRRQIPRKTDENFFRGGDFYPAARCAFVATNAQRAIYD
jgi:hypothetical protein